MNYRHAFTRRLCHVISNRAGAIAAHLQENPPPFASSTPGRRRPLRSHGEEARPRRRMATGIARLMQGALSKTRCRGWRLSYIIVPSTHSRAKGLSRSPPDPSALPGGPGPDHGVRDRAERAQAFDRFAAPRHPARVSDLDGWTARRPSCRRTSARPGSIDPSVEQRTISDAGGRLCRGPTQMADRSYLLVPVTSRRSPTAGPRQGAAAALARRLPGNVCVSNSASHRRQAAAPSPHRLLIVNPPMDASGD